MLLDNQILATFRNIQQEGKTGLLKFAKDGKTIVFYFRNGRIDGAGSDIENLQLGKTLIRSLGLKSSILPKLLDHARRKHWLIGKAVVLLNHLDNSELRYGVREQIIQAAAFVLYQEFQVVSFEDSSLELYMPARMNIDELVLELARKNFNPGNFDEQQIVLNNGQNLAHFPWYPEEISVLGRLQTPCTLNDLAASTGMDTVSLNKILSVFDTLNLITSTDEPAELGGGEEPALHDLIPEIHHPVVSNKLETYNNAISFISEQFNNLKVRISEAAVSAPLRVIAISSSQPEDGKSLICANLAVSFSKDPKRRVLVIDCDLRNPTLHKYLGISIEPGLLSYFENDKLQPYCFLRRLGSLYVMTAGGISANPVDYLSGPVMADMIRLFKNEFDTIILDCPPFGPISDAQIMTGITDGLLMVVRSGKTNYGNLEKACRYMDRNKLIGLVFNDVKPMLFNTEYDYRYYRYGSTYPYRAAKNSHRPKKYLE
jgi:capsular exopolysaccharide synthesis family protein